MTPNKLGEIIIKSGLVPSAKIAKALEEQKKSGQKLSQILIAQGILKDIQILKILGLEMVFQPLGPHQDL